MFDFVRFAAVATFALGVAGGSDRIAKAAETVPSTAASIVPTPAIVDTAPLPPAPDVLPMAQLPSTRHASVEPVQPTVNDRDETSSLNELVRRHSASDTATRDQECLAVATYFEAKGEPLDGQLAVARVILNRAASGRFATSVCGVVTQRGQFSFVRGGSMPSVPRASANWRTAVAIAHIATNDLWTASTEDALYFHARHVAPNWRMTRVAAIGNHVFYR